MADFDPFSAAGFAPVTKVPDAGDLDPFKAAGMVPVPTPQVAQPSATAPMPTPTGFDEFGTPQFDSSTPEGLAANRQVRQIPLKAAEGATLGLSPHILAGAGTLGGKSYGEGLNQARTDLAQASTDQPIASGLANAAGGLLPTVLGFKAAGPMIDAAASYAPRVGGFLARTLTGGLLGGANAGGSDIGTGQTENIGGDVARGGLTGALLQGVGEAVGKGAQAVSNMGQGVYQGLRNIGTTAGREGVVGQILREAQGPFPNQAARSPLPGLELRPAQVTANPGLASLEDTLSQSGEINAGPPGSRVSTHITPDQTLALRSGLVGSDAGIEPSVLTNQASARGTQAIINSRNVLRQAENDLWNAPELTGVRLHTAPLLTGVQADVARMPPSFQTAVTRGPLNGFMQDIEALPDGASIADVNAVRSRILGQARTSRAAGDNVTATAAQGLADSLLNRVEGALGGAGAQVQDAYSTARDFTRQRAQAFGQPQFDAILRPNAAGNMRADPEAAFGRFFDLHGGQSGGMQHLQGVSDLLRTTGQPEAIAAANELEGSARQYVNAGVLKQARTGGATDATGAPAMTPSGLQTVESTVNRLAPALNTVPMMAPMAGDLQAAGNAAGLLARPKASGGTGSQTYERLKNNELVSAIIGQSGSSGLGAAAGAYGGYRASDMTGVPPWLTIPAGMAAGALGGSAARGPVGKLVAGNPFTRGLVAGPSTAIQRQLWEALASMPEYTRAVATPMISGPALGQTGRVEQSISPLGRVLIGPSTGRSAQ